MTRRIRTYAQTTEPAGAELVAQIDAQFERIRVRLAGIRSTILVASGKGGVGKSFVAAALAAAMADRDLRVGALDADVNGPSLARMLGVIPARLRVDADGVHPALTRARCVVMSSDLLLAEPDAPLRWREPQAGGFVWQSALETGMLREFLSDVCWGVLDALVIDMPPGTDKIARILPLLPSINAVLLVTTPSAVASAAVARSFTQLRDAGLNNIVLVRNMDGYVCPACRTISRLFAPVGVTVDDTSDSRNAASDALADIPRLSIPFDPRAAAAIDSGARLPDDSPVNGPLARIISRIATISEPATDTRP